MLYLLLEHATIKTLKRQRVFYFDKVPHDQLLVAAVLRDNKRIKQQQQPATTHSTPPTFFTDLLLEQDCPDSVLSVITKFKPEVMVTRPPPAQQTPPDHANSTQPSTIHSKTLPLATDVVPRPVQSNPVVGRAGQGLGRLWCSVGGCGRGFGRVEHLKRHQLTHQNLKPHQCTICNKHFSRKDNLLQHVSYPIQTGLSCSRLSAPLCLVRSLTRSPGHALHHNLSSKPTTHNGQQTKVTLNPHITQSQHFPSLNPPLLNSPNTNSHSLLTEAPTPSTGTPAPLAPG